jgi:hypothetical protein
MHFVGDQEHVVLGADRPDALEVIVGRHDHAARALHRLGNECRHGVGPFAKDRLFELVGRGNAETHRGIGVNEAIRVRRIDVRETGRARLEHRPKRRQSGGAHRRERDAVIRAHA